ncbi:MAG TPA: hypothetical protein VME21_09590 [Steroidobacteraceae bacterium]|nr:hypothetical protein [Steroidobacteraceae bacterium]
MTARRKGRPRDPLDEGLSALAPRASVPHEFVLEALASLDIDTRRMFGCLAVYVKEKIVLILRERADYPADNGVWLATTAQHHESLRHDFPRMRSIGLLGHEVTNWQVLPADAADFEEAALRACRLIVARDPRIGNIPKRRRRLARASTKAAKRRPQPR